MLTSYPGTVEQCDGNPESLGIDGERICLKYHKLMGLV